MVHASAVRASATREKLIGEDELSPRSPFRRKNSQEKTKFFKWRTALCIFLWFASSLGALLMNKTLLSPAIGLPPPLLGITQMTATTVIGFVTIHFVAEPKMTKGVPPLNGIYLTLLLLAALRALAVALSLLALSHVAASFVETIKASAPFFTVYLQYMILSEPSSRRELLTLLPVAGGLIICAKTELTFDMVGFWAAIFNNVVDCFQNVLTKKVLKLEVVTPTRLQFLTSLLALVIHVPLVIAYEFDLSGLCADLWRAENRTEHLTKLVEAGRRPAPAPSYHTSKVAFFLLFNVTCVHVQSLTAFYVVNDILPVSMSVINTLKRALLIVYSVYYFGNPMNASSILGVGVVIVGVFFYNRARFPDPIPPSRVHDTISCIPAAGADDDVDEDDEDNEEDPSLKRIQRKKT